MAHERMLEDMRAHLLRSSQRVAVARSNFVNDYASVQRAMVARRLEHWVWEPASDIVVRSNSLDDLDGINGGEQWHRGDDSYAAASG